MAAIKMPAGGTGGLFSAVDIGATGTQTYAFGPLPANWMAKSLRIMCRSTINNETDPAQSYFSASLHVFGRSRPTDDGVMADANSGGRPVFQTLVCYMPILNSSGGLSGSGDANPVPHDFPIPPVTADGDVYYLLKIQAGGNASVKGYAYLEVIKRSQENLP